MNLKVQLDDEENIESFVPFQQRALTCSSNIRNMTFRLAPKLRWERSPEPVSEVNFDENTSQTDKLSRLLHPPFTWP